MLNRGHGSSARRGRLRPQKTKAELTASFLAVQLVSVVAAVIGPRYSTSDRGSIASARGNWKCGGSSSGSVVDIVSRRQASDQSQGGARPTRPHALLRVQAASNQRA